MLAVPFPTFAVMAPHGHIIRDKRGVYKWSHKDVAVPNDTVVDDDFLANNQ